MKLYEGEYKRDNQELKAKNEQLKKELAAAKRPKAKPKPAPTKKTTKKKRVTGDRNPIVFMESRK